MKHASVDERPVIFHLITAFGIGGAERLIEQSLPKLTEYKHMVISLRGDGPIRERFEQAGLAVAVLNMRFPFSPWAFFAFFRLVRQHRPLILTTYLVHADLIGRVWGRLCGIPHVVSYLVARYRGSRYRLVILLMSWTDWLVDRNIAVSEEVKRFFVEDVHLSAKKFTVIVNSVDSTMYVPSKNPVDRENFLRQINLQNDTLIIGTVSNLRPEKGIDRLIQAMPYVFNLQPKAYGVIIGDGVDRIKLEQQCVQLGISDRVRFLRHWPDITPILPLLDIFVLPSFFEGMSIALLEAMSTARPIIATKTPENQEVITAGSGLLVDTADSKQLGKAINSLLEDPDYRQILGQAARNRIKNNFSLEQSTVALNNFYHQFK